MMSDFTPRKLSIQSGPPHPVRTRIKFKVSPQQENALKTYGIRRIPKSIVSTPYTHIAGLRVSDIGDIDSDTGRHPLSITSNATGFTEVEEPQEPKSLLKSILKEKNFKYPKVDPQSSKSIGPKTKTVSVIVPHKLSNLEKEKELTPANMQLSFEYRRRQFHEAEFTIAKNGKKMSDMFVGKPIHSVDDIDNRDKIATELKQLIKEGLLTPAYDISGRNFEFSNTLMENIMHEDKATVNY